MQSEKSTSEEFVEFLGKLEEGRVSREEILKYHKDFFRDPTNFSNIATLAAKEGLDFEKILTNLDGSLQDIQKHKGMLSFWSSTHLNLVTGEIIFLVEALNCMNQNSELQGNEQAVGGLNTLLSRSVESKNLKSLVNVILEQGIEGEIGNVKEIVFMNQGDIAGKGAIEYFKANNIKLDIKDMKASLLKNESISDLLNSGVVILNDIIELTKKQGFPFDQLTQKFHPTDEGLLSNILGSEKTIIKAIAIKMQDNEEYIGMLLANSIGAKAGNTVADLLVELIKLDKLPIELFNKYAASLDEGEFKDILSNSNYIKENIGSLDPKLANNDPLFGLLTNKGIVDEITTENAENIGEILELRIKRLAQGKEGKVEEGVLNLMAELVVAYKREEDIRRQNAIENVFQKCQKALNEGKNISKESKESLFAVLDFMNEKPLIAKKWVTDTGVVTRKKGDIISEVEKKKLGQDASYKPLLQKERLTQDVEIESVLLQSANVASYAVQAFTIQELSEKVMGLETVGVKVEKTTAETFTTALCKFSKAVANLFKDLVNWNKLKQAEFIDQIGEFAKLKFKEVEKQAEFLDKFEPNGNLQQNCVAQIEKIAEQEQERNL